MSYFKNIVLFLTSFVLFLFLTPYNANANTWQDVAPLPQANGTVVATTGLDGLIYVVDPSGGSNGFRAYNPQTDSWTTLAPMPTSRFSLSLQAGDDGLIYAIGGNDGGTTDYTIVEAYDPSTDTWSCSVGDSAPDCVSSTIEPMPTARSSIQGASALGADGKIYVIGGNTTSGYTNVVEAYDPSTNTWSSLDELAVARDGRAVAGDDGLIYYMGGTGCPEEPCEGLDTVEIYNPSTNTWSMGAAMPVNRSQFAIAKGADNLIYAVGGLTQTEEYEVVSSVDVYNPQTDSWSSATALPFARSYIAGASKDGLIYAIGGTLCICNTFETTVQVLDTNASDELTVLDPAKVWLSKGILNFGVRFDVLVEAYKDSTLVSSGQVNSVLVGSGFFNNATLVTVPFDSFTPVNFPTGSELQLKVSVRNACSGSLLNFGTARLWYNDSAADSHFGATIGSETDDYFLLDGFLLSNVVGSGPRKQIAVQAETRCSSFKSFGTWTVTP